MNYGTFKRVENGKRKTIKRSNVLHGKS